MRTEYEYYPPGTEYLLLPVVNDTDETLIYSDMRWLECWNGEGWRWAQQSASSTWGGSYILPGENDVLTFHIPRCARPLPEGRYRVVVECYPDGAPATAGTNGWLPTHAFAEFAVTTDEEFWGKGTLYFEDFLADIILLADIRRDAPLLVYKERDTWDTYVAMGGQRYEIAKGSGEPGVTSVQAFLLGENEYLAYACTRNVEGARITYAGVFSLDTCEEVFYTRVSGMDDAMVYPGDGEIYVDSYHYEDLLNGRGAGRRSRPLGAIIYEPGGFVYYTYPKWRKLQK